LSVPTLKGLKENKYFVPTEIQRESIGYSLRGEDILGAAKTGSGKTLAFLIPVSKLLEILKIVYDNIDKFIRYWKYCIATNGIVLKG